MSARCFRVPFGAAPDGEIVPVESAEAGTPYACPACSAPLVFRAGEVRRHHFAHRVDANCSPETALHDATKRRIANAVNAWRADAGPRPSIVRPCPTCGAGNPSPISERAASAAIEHRLPSGRVLDVGILDAEGRVMLGIEVLVSHAVDAEKEADLVGLTWIEVEAASVEDAATWPAWRCAGSASAVRCEPCEQRPAWRRAATAEIARRYGHPEPARGYFAVEHPCWSCGKPTPVYYWPGIGFEHEAPSPRPPSVKVRYSKTIGRSYWANGCTHCGALQGDHYLPQILSEHLDGPDAGAIWAAFFEPSNERERADGARAAVGTAVALAHYIVPD